MPSNQNLYEIRLREEFKMMRRLQNDSDVRGVLQIFFTDRLSQNQFGIGHETESQLYPEQYQVNVKMPVYTDVNVLNKNWEGGLSVKVNYSVLMNPGSNNPPETKLDVSNALPFNHHISPTWLCIGGIWSVAKDFGLWYFILGCCSLVNQEAAWMDDSGSGHLQPLAYRFWKIDRHKQRVNNINWPFDLRARSEGKDNQQPVKLKIKIGIKQTSNIPKIKIIRK